MHLRLRKCEKSPQTCGFAVAEHLLQFCGIEFKFAVPSSEKHITKRSSAIRNFAQKPITFRKHDIRLVVCTSE